MLPDLLQPQGQQDLSWRCVCTGKSFPSEPESSEAQARVSSAIQFFFQSCAEIVCDTWKHLHGWLCSFLTHDHSSNKSTPFVTNNWMYMLCLTARNRFCSLVFISFPYMLLQTYIQTSVHSCACTCPLFWQFCGSVEIFRVTTKHFNFCEIALWGIIETLAT